MQYIQKIKNTFQWHAGNFVCKGLMMVRTGGYILSSLMLIVLSIDRCLDDDIDDEDGYVHRRVVLMMITMRTMIINDGDDGFDDDDSIGKLCPLSSQRLQ